MRDGSPSDHMRRASRQRALTPRTNVSFPRAVTRLCVKAAVPSRAFAPRLAAELKKALPWIMEGDTGRFSALQELLFSSFVPTGGDDLPGAGCRLCLTLFLFVFCPVWTSSVMNHTHLSIYLSIYLSMSHTAPAELGIKIFQSCTVCRIKCQHLTVLQTSDWLTFVGVVGTSLSHHVHITYNIC